MTRDTADREGRSHPAAQVIFRDVMDGVAMVEAFYVPPARTLEALPRPAPPQEEPRPWWRWRPWR